MAVPSRTTREPRLTRRQALRAVGVAAALTLIPGAASAAWTKTGCRPQDELWIVSTRHLGCPSGCARNVSWDIQQCVDGQWQRRSADQFFGTVNNVERTLFFVHGNRTEVDEVVPRGLAVHSALLNSCVSHPPVRFVLWSWPSDRIHGQLKDVRAKAQRSDLERYYMAPFLARFPDGYPVGIVAYSYGARITNGALNLIGEQTTTASLAAGPQFHSALWAAASNNDWLLAGGAHQWAPVACPDWFITFNSCDPALKWYHVVDKCNPGEALGYTGLPNGPILDSPRINQMNVSGMVGDTHDLYRYLQFEPILAGSREVVLREGRQ